jgi:uncharacterized delta-60 repeat protein
MKKTVLLWVMFFCFLPVTYAQPGELDSSFGINGIVAADLGASYNYNYSFAAKKVLVQSDGSIFLILQIGYKTIITKRLSNNAADSSYGHDGYSTPAIIFSNDAASQQDGKIVIVGRTPGNNYDFAIVRYNSDGSLDNTFNDDGKQRQTFILMMKQNQ